MVVDRLPDLLGQPFLAGIDSAHRALELGELADHVGRKIRFAEPGGAFSACCGVGATEGFFGEPRRQRSDAIGFFLIAPQLLVKEDRRQPVDA